MSFRLFYPEGTIILRDDKPETVESEGFTVENLAPGEEGKIEVKAFIVGDKGAIKTARAHVIFKAGTLRSAFEKEVTATTTIAELPVTMTLVAPPTAVANSNLQYILDVRNDSGQDLSDLKVELQYPDGFVVQKFQPQPSQGNTLWDIRTLKVGEGTRITIDGALPGNERETKTVTAVLRRNLNGQYVDYARTEAFTVISSPLLSISISPAEGRDYVSFAGDTLRYTVTYKNNSRYTFMGLLLGVKLEGEMYDTARLDVEDGFFDEASKTVVFDSAGNPSLGQLPPGGSGSVRFSVPLKAGFAGGSGTSSFFVKSTVRLSTTNVPSGIDQDEISALDSLITKISTQPSISQTIQYDNGAGSGPMPPKVGQETTFTVRWQLTNPGNDVRNTKVTVALPPGVSWKDGAVAVTGGTAPTFDATTSTVTWSVGTLPFGTGNGMPRYEATFKIGIRPSSNQVGSSVPLLTATTLNGTDSFASQPIQVRLRELSTEHVENHSGEGRVE